MSHSEPDFQGRRVSGHVIVDGCETSFELYCSLKLMSTGLVGKAKLPL